ncbi:hydroxyethylthiazole kinase [Caproiciproducens sp. NJN-50]|uniref:hydroxyethylthiazole kinase n=1 Tax=Acutalibacteraceae TaxID=3082771 RepID=UPI000FFE08CB|nr:MULTISPECIES: hydroxyethylthiazole kinase [Acutalibacteraceae]QAT49372.1 hydroxyethylthiazole kinase [Caproiciproducens sp. NJN-50]
MNQITKDAAEVLSEVRRKSPLVHNITNYVTVNDCANALLAFGASPIMADDIGEAADIASISSALVLNIGTLNRRTVESMLAAGAKANELGIPVVLDPVGAGASALRNRAVRELLKRIRMTVLRGNLSELSFLAGIRSATKGVDASEADSGNDAVSVAVSVAEQYGCAAAVTGAVDVLSDGERTVKIRNGHPMLSSVTGTGCMTSALAGACAAVSHDPLAAAAAAVAAMGIAGELAYEAAGSAGTGGFHIAVIDALSRLDPALFEKRAKLDEA